MLEGCEPSNVLESVRTGFDQAAFEIVRRRLGVTTVELTELLGLVPASTEAVNDGDVGSWVDASTLSRRPGERWLREASSRALLVPSAALGPAPMNVLVDPAHPNIGALVIERVVPHAFDERLRSLLP